MKGYMLIRKKKDLTQMLGIYHSFQEARYIMRRNAKKKDFGTQEIMETHNKPTVRRMV